MHSSSWMVAAGAAALAGCMANQGPAAQAAGGSGRQCFLASQVNSFDAVDDQTVVVRTGVRTMYELQIVGVCPDIDWTQRIGIRSTGGSNWVCHGLDAELLVPSPSGTQRCPVTDIRRLSEAEVETFRARKRD